MIIKKHILTRKNTLIFSVLLVMLLFFGCKKEDPCKSVVQGDFELVK